MYLITTFVVAKVDFQKGRNLFLVFLQKDRNINMNYGQNLTETKNMKLTPHMTLWFL